MATSVRAHPQRLPETERNRDAPYPARAHRGGLSHLLGQARRLHQAAHHGERHMKRTGNEVPYTREERPAAESSAQLRVRIPGWGVDLNATDRPSVPRLQPQPDPAGLASPGFPPRQQETWPRERSIE